jgi:hypothetical protein
MIALQLGAAGTKRIGGKSTFFLIIDFGTTMCNCKVLHCGVITIWLSSSFTKKPIKAGFSFPTNSK